MPVELYDIRVRTVSTTDLNFESKVSNLYSRDPTKLRTKMSVKCVFLTFLAKTRLNFDIFQKIR